MTIIANDPIEGHILKVGQFLICSTLSAWPDYTLSLLPMNANGTSSDVFVILNAFEKVDALL